MTTTMTTTEQKEVCDYNPFRRPRYFHGMLLDEKDFLAEQSYQIEKRHLLNRMLYGYGVVCGLGLEWKKGKQWIQITPGLALDCCGNEIYASDRLQVDLAELLPENRGRSREECETPEDEDQPKDYYLCVQYKAMPTNPRPVYVSGGDCDERTCDSSRVKEGYCVKLLEYCPKPKSKDGLLQELCDCQCESDPSAPYTPGKPSGQYESDPSAPHTPGKPSSQYESDPSTPYTPGKPSSQYESDPSAPHTPGKPSSQYEPDPSAPQQHGKPSEKSYAYPDYEETCEDKVLKSFCNTTLPCPECPDCGHSNHCVVLGRIRVDAAGCLLYVWPNDCRKYVLTGRLLEHLVTCTFSGTDDWFTVRQSNGKEEAPLRVDEIVRNPIKALCWFFEKFVIEGARLSATELGKKCGKIFRTKMTGFVTEDNHQTDLKTAFAQKINEWQKDVQQQQAQMVSKKDHDSMKQYFEEQIQACQKEIAALKKPRARKR